MGGVCARCADVKKAKDERHSPLREYPSEESLDESDDTEVAASSDEDEGDEEYRHGVEEILKTTGQTLKRGKTMAMKEAISTAKKWNIEAATVAEAEKRLHDHKMQQRREELEIEISTFFTDGAKDRSTCEKLIKRATEVECRKELIKRLQEQLKEIISMRDLEEDEFEQTKDYLKQSCRDFVNAATRHGGRLSLLLDLDSGRKIPSNLTLDPPLQRLSLCQDEDSNEAVVIEAKSVELCALMPKAAKDDKTVKRSAGFKLLEDGDRECAVALRYEVDRVQGVWCLIESTPNRRDRLIEALLMLATIC